MTTVSRPNKDALIRALDIYRDAMRPFIIRSMRNASGKRVEDAIKYSLNPNQVAQFEQNMIRNGGDLEASIDINDFPSLIGRNWRDVFSRQFVSGGQTVQNAAWLIKEARDDASHPGTQDIDWEFTLAHLFHIADVLGKINAPEQRKAVEEIRDNLAAPIQSQTSIDGPEPETNVRASDEFPQRQVRSSANLSPWRSVIRVNPDVAQGTFQQSEFAADLQQVYDGRAVPQYGDPVRFFNHTFITPGIRTLLVNILRRMEDNGGEPVIQTKTGFGGGKTHSLIALYHLINSAGALTNPAAQSGESERTSADIHKMMEEAGMDSDVGLDAKIAVLDCTYLSPTNVSRVVNGDSVSTLWGEMAFQLGGEEAYDIVSEASRRGTSPAGELDELFQSVGPCVILIDELVSYVRNAGDAQDNIYTFVQNLTQAVRRNRQTALVVTLPEHAIEAGADIGIEALGRLDNILGRIEATWEPLEVNEAFEVVRRRLFGNVIDEAERDRTCEAFVTTYSRNRSDFPQGVSEQVYLQRMKDCYPIHPEIFDRLYTDWSAIPQFQRTRGVLRMMAACISRLHLNGDSSPLIMPGSLTLSDPALANEFVRLLDGNWTAVLSEVDRDNSRTDDIDKSVRRFADVGGAARRIARTVFLGSAPSGSVRGGDVKQIRLGTVQPGHGVSVYNEALGRMAGDLYFLYSADDRYFFHVEENLNKVATDRAGAMTEREVYDEIHSVMREAVGSRSDVIIFPQNSGEVPDIDNVRLVILPPDKSLPSRSAENNDAEFEARDILSRRADASRVRKNTLLFLASRRDEVRHLDRVVRNYLAWHSIQEGDRRIENLEGDRRRQVVESVRHAASEVRAALVNAYRWAMAPFQPDPQDSSKFDMTTWQINSQDTGQIVESAFAKFIEEEALVETLSPDALGAMLNQYIWNSDRDHVSVEQLWDMMASYVYMHRLRNKSVLVDCIRLGVPESKFGYAEGYDADADTNQYRGMRFDEGMDEGLFGISDLGHGLLVNPDMARLVKEEQAERRPDDEPEPSLPAEPGVPTAPPGRPVVDTVPPSGPPAVTQIIVNKSFQGDIDLNDISLLNEEIIRNLKAEDAEIKVSVTVSATKGGGFSENTTRSVKENSLQLGLDFEQI